MANSVDPDDMACCKPFHLDLHCLLKCLFWSAEIKVPEFIYCIFELGHVHLYIVANKGFHSIIKNTTADSVDTYLLSHLYLYCLNR